MVFKELKHIIRILKLFMLSICDYGVLAPLVVASHIQPFFFVYDGVVFIIPLVAITQKMIMKRGVLAQLVIESSLFEVRLRLKFLVFVFNGHEQAIIVL